MNLFRCFPLLALSLFVAADLHSSSAAEKPRPHEEVEAAARLQVFLDRAEFAPGKIDGRYGEFTVKALSLYREAKGQPAPALTVPKDGAKKAAVQSPPDLAGLDLASVDPVFVSYTVTEADLKNIGEVPESIPAQAKAKSLPYQTAAEALGEKFHTDVDFIEELNPGKSKNIKAGDVLTVPNVTPFEFAEVKNLQPGSEIDAAAANDVDDPADANNGDGEKVAQKGDKAQPGKDDRPAKDEKASAPEQWKKSEKTAQNDEKAAAKKEPSTSVKIDVKNEMLSVYESDKLIAAFPVTIGSAQTESPVGDWKIQRIAKMPNFRYDKAMLNKGERSDDFHVLPPGPNNPVGVLWIALNKKGIGLHGTDEPDSIGRSASHGCVRLANWDVVRLAGKVKPGVRVSIH